MVDGGIPWLTEVSHGRREVSLGRREVSLGERRYSWVDGGIPGLTEVSLVVPCLVYTALVHRLYTPPGTHPLTAHYRCTRYRHGHTGHSGHSGPMPAPRAGLPDRGIYLRGE